MHREHFKRNKVRLISFLSLLLGFLDAFFIYVLSSYFVSMTGSDNVGIFYFLAYSAVFVWLFFLQRLIRRIGQAHVLYLSLGLSMCAAALLATSSSLWLSVCGALTLIIATNVTWVALDIILESFSQDRVSGSIRGLYLTIMNAGLLAAPFLSLRTLENFQYGGIFLTLVIGYTIVFVIALVGFRTDNKVSQPKLRFGSTLKKMLSERNLLRIYHVSFALEFFYALMIVYTPIYLRSLQYTWDDIGILFTIMLIPFVVLQYPLGLLADRYFGEKEMLIGSIALTVAATLTLPTLGAGNILAWGVTLFMTRVGVAGIEILRDSYFYKQIDGGDMDVIAFFRTARPVANMVAAVLSILLLFVFPLWSVFWVVALMLLFSLIETCFLHDSLGSRDPRTETGQRAISLEK